MLLTGTFHRTLDDKLRFSMPKRLRQGLDQQLVYLTRGTDDSLWMYPGSVFEALAQQLSHAPPTGQDVRTFSRLFFAQAESQEIDSQGRVRIPAALATLATLTKEIVLLGVRDHLELWDRAKWEEYLAGQQPHYDEVAERVLGGGQVAPAAPSDAAVPPAVPRQPR
jgi:MraZ protein